MDKIEIRRISPIGRIGINQKFFDTAMVTLHILWLRLKQKL